MILDDSSTFYSVHASIEKRRDIILPYSWIQRKEARRAPTVLYCNLCLNSYVRIPHDLLEWFMMHQVKKPSGYMLKASQARRASAKTLPGMLSSVNNNSMIVAFLFPLPDGDDHVPLQIWGKWTRPKAARVAMEPSIHHRCREFIKDVADIPCLTLLQFRLKFHTHWGIRP